jgi:hypothetical protein
MAALPAQRARDVDALRRLARERAPDADSAGAKRGRTAAAHDVAGDLVETEHVAGVGVAWRRRAQIADDNKQVPLRPGLM